MAEGELFAHRKKRLETKQAKQISLNDRLGAYARVRPS